MAGRPRTYTPERRAQVLDALQVGDTRRAACMRAGISEDTFARWLVQHADFAEAVRAHESDGRLVLVAGIREAALGGAVLARETVEKVDAKGVVVGRTVRETLSQPDWRAAAWLLERRHNEDWGRRERVEGVLLDRTLMAIAEELGVSYDAVLAETERQVEQSQPAARRRAGGSLRVVS